MNSYDNKTTGIENPLHPANECEQYSEEQMFKDEIERLESELRLKLKHANERSKYQKERFDKIKSILEMHTITGKLTEKEIKELKKLADG